MARYGRSPVPNRVTRPGTLVLISTLNHTEKWDVGTSVGARGYVRHPRHDRPLRATCAAMNRHENRTVPVPNMVAFGLWVTTVVTLLATLVTVLAGHYAIGFILGITSGVLAPAASTASVWCFALRIIRLIRAHNNAPGVEGTHTADLHSVR